MSFESHNSELERAVVLGIGNLLLKDEGIGSHVVQALEGMQLPPGLNVQLIDGGTAPDILLSLGKVNKLIIIDAAKGGGEPGAIYRFHPEAMALDSGPVLSLHQMSLAESLRMMECLGSRPEDIVIIGVEPKEIDWGLELSPELEDKLPRIIELVLEEL